MGEVLGRTFVKFFSLLLSEALLGWHWIGLRLRMLVT